MRDPPFRTGDRVRLKTGKSLILVSEVDFFDTPPKGWTKRGWSKRYVKAKMDKQWFIRFDYASSTNYGGSDYGYEKSRQWREASDFTLFDEDTPVHILEKEEPMTKPSLYQTKAQPLRYGTFLIKNSAGQMVLEMKGEGGAVESFDEDAIEVVTPYTVELTMLGIDPSGPNKSKSIHVVVQKGMASKDDVFLELNTGVIWRVTVVNSKCLTPRENKSKWMKVPATFVTFGE